MANYEDFLETVTPFVIGLSSTSCQLDRPLYWVKRKTPFQRVLDSSYKIECIEEGYFDVLASFEFSIRSVEADKSVETSVVVSPLKITCGFHGHFHFEGQPSTEHIQRFAEHDCWILFWPYFRQFVADTTARMHIPPETLPLGLTPGEFVRQVAGAKPKEIAAKAAPKRIATKLKKR